MSQVIIAGDTSGTITLQAPAVSGSTTLTLPATTGNFLTSTTQLIGTGTTTNNDASAGQVGEYVVSTIASSGTSLTTGSYVNVTSISLTAGDWDINGICSFTSPGSPVISYLNWGSSLTSATAGVNGAISSYTGGSVNTVDFSLPFPTFRYSLSGTTTIYLVARASWTTSTMSSYGSIRARRVR